MFRSLFQNISVVLFCCLYLLQCIQGLKGAGIFFFKRSYKFSIEPKIQESFINFQTPENLTLDKTQHQNRAGNPNSNFYNFLLVPIFRQAG